jgi:hypothetical protein
MRGFRCSLILLVCRTDGIVSLSRPDLWPLIGIESGSATIGVARKPRQLCDVSAPFGTLPRKLAESTFANELLLRES